jgi:hypothetical protein
MIKNMKKITLLVSIIIVSATLVFAQEKQPTGRKQIQQLMQEKISVLKNGALLVRIHTKENSIEALKSSGQVDVAKQVEEKQIAYNNEVITAFRSEYKFCPVYFFSSKYSENVASGKMDEVVFYNDKLMEDSTIKFVQGDFLTAEFGPLDPDTATYYEGDYYDRSGKGLEEKDAQYGASNLGIEALKIMNKQFIQLRDPFPYYVRTYDSLPVERKLSKAVAKMNKQLNDYYAKNKSK